MDQSSGEQPLRLMDYVVWAGQEEGENGRERVEQLCLQLCIATVLWFLSWAFGSHLLWYFHVLRLEAEQQAAYAAGGQHVLMGILLFVLFLRLILWLRGFKIRQPA